MKIIIFDTETTGLPIKDGSLDKQPYLTQFASITFDYNSVNKLFQEQSRFNQLIKPPIAIPADAIRINGINDQTVLNMPAFIQIQPTITKLFQDANIAIAHNLEFDRLMLSLEFQRMGLSTNILPLETYDSMEKTRDLCKLPGRSSGYKAPRLMELHQFLLGEAFAGAHNAMSDVEALARCIKVLLQQGFYQPSQPLKTSVDFRSSNSAAQTSLF